MKIKGKYIRGGWGYVSPKEMRHYMRKTSRKNRKVNNKLVNLHIRNQQSKQLGEILI